MNNFVQTVRDYSLSYKDLFFGGYVERQNLINELEALVSNESKCVIVEGSSGLGKTNLLLQFANQHKFDCISYFFNPAYKFSGMQDYIMEDLGKQIFFFNKLESPNPDLEFTEGSFNKVAFDLTRGSSRKNRPVYFVLDGLDQLDKPSLDTARALISQLPWSTNNFYFIVSGEREKLRTIIPDSVFRKSQTLRVIPFAAEETQTLFNNYGSSNQENIREIHNAWKGHPERLAQIKRILDNGVSIESFLTINNIQGKNELSAMEWENSNVFNLDFSSNLFKLVCILTFSENTRSVNKIKNILEIKDDEFDSELAKTSFLVVKNDEVSFVSYSMQAYVNKVLRKYEADITSLLINYYAKQESLEAVLNLSSLYEKKREWTSVVQLLTLDNLNLIVSDSKSFADIKRQINHGFIASNSLKHSFSNLLKFSLYRSTLSAFQRSDTSETQLQAYAALDKSEEALLLISNAVIKEDRLRMFISYAKEITSKGETIHESVTKEIKSLLAAVDIEYIEENAVDIVLGLAHILPEEAVQLVEKVSGIKAENGTLEWLLGYVATIVAKDKNKAQNSGIKVEGKIYSTNDFVDKFAKSIGYGISEVADSEVLQKVKKIDNISDRLYMLRRWINRNGNSPNIFQIIHYALDLLLEDALKAKPTTTILLDIVKPIQTSVDIALIKAMISRLDSLMLTITSPTSDRVKLQNLIIECVFKFDPEDANIRAMTLLGSIEQMTDYSIKAEALAYCLNMVVNIAGNKLYTESRFLLDVDFSKLAINQTVDKLLLSVAEQYDETEDTLKSLARFDIAFALEIANRLNILNRRDAAKLLCLTEYVEIGIQNWNINDVKNIITGIEQSDSYVTALITVFRAASDQKEHSPLNREKIYDLLPLIEKVGDNGLKCYLISKAIQLLSRLPVKPDGIVLNYTPLTAKLSSYLEKFYNKIDTSWHRIQIGYRLAADLASTNKELANNYFNIAEQLSKDNIINNGFHAGLIFDSVRLVIRCFCGLLKSDASISYLPINTMITQIPSTISQVSLWAELAVRAHLVGANEVTSDIVNKRLLPQLERYKAEKDRVYFASIFKLIASAVFSVDPDSLIKHMSEISTSDIDDVVSSICFVLLTDCHESDPYEDVKGSSTFTYTKALKYISIIEFLDIDSSLYYHISNLCEIAKAYPDKFLRDQKSDIYSKLQSLVDAKLPNRETGVNHDGFLIAAKASILHFSNASASEVAQNMEKLGAMALSIPNDADRAYTYSLLSDEITPRRKKLEYLIKAFEHSDKVLSIKEKISSYRVALNLVYKVSPELFSQKMRQIHLEVFKLDESQIFPTYQKLIDLAYKHDKGLAQRLVSDLDNDPARKQMATPATKHLDNLSDESTVLKDYSKMSIIKNGRLSSRVIRKMLGKLNAGIGNAREISETSSLLSKASRMSLFYSMPIYEYFTQNAIKNDTTDFKLLQSFYESASNSSKLCYNIISSVLERDSNKYILNDALGVDSFNAKPGLRIEAIQFIGKYLKDSEAKEIYIIDSSFSDKDMEFIKSVVGWCPRSKISVLTSCEASGDFSKLSFKKAWQVISNEVVPQIEFVSASTQLLKSPVDEVCILLYDKGQGIKLDTSIHAAGVTKSAVISVMEIDDIKEMYSSIVSPLIFDRSREYDGFSIKYESFDL